MNRNMFTRVSLAVVIVGLVLLSAIAQQPEVRPLLKQPPTLEREAQGQTVIRPLEIRVRLFRPNDITDLVDYLDRYAQGKYNPSTLVSSVNESGQAKITFSYFEDGLWKDTDIVDLGYCLDFKQTATPAFGEDPMLTADTETTRNRSTDRVVPRPDVSNPDEMAAQSVTTTCAGLTSTNNPYPCCSGATGLTGNCTFAAWEMAKRYWNGVTLSSTSWGNAGQWWNAAQGKLPTSRTPALFSVAVSLANGGLDSRGHVGLVTAINGSASAPLITLNDQQCGNNVTTERQYQLYHFSTGGYILDPAVNSQSLTVSGMSPQTLRSGNYDQQVLFSVSNIQGNLRAIVIFPSGWRSTLTPSAQIWVYGYQTVGTRMRLSEVGMYSIQFFNTNGVFSRLYSFRVN